VNVLWPKCLELLSRITPTVTAFGALISGDGQDEHAREAMQAAARNLDKTLFAATAKTGDGVLPAFEGGQVMELTVAIGGNADADGWTAWAERDADDPLRPSPNGQ
jgi:hypothetical protein